MAQVAKTNIVVLELVQSQVQITKWMQWKRGVVGEKGDDHAEKNCENKDNINGAHHLPKV